MQTALSILGSTGSIGQQTLQIVRDHPEQYKVLCLTGGNNWQLLVEQALEFKPQIVAMADTQAAQYAAKELGETVKVLSGEAGILHAASMPQSDIVVAAIVGFAGLRSVIEAIRCDKAIALANKESLIAGGALLQATLRTSKSKVVPVDSEHNSIFQCLDDKDSKRRASKIFLTASGGPFLNRPLNTFSSITPGEAVKHPRWSMGAKISIDSATLVNKGLEVIEAAYLFDLPAHSIEILVHPESIVHGLVDFVDGATHAVLYPPDMKVPIFHALETLRGAGTPIANNRSVAELLLSEGKSLNFLAVDHARFPAVDLCYAALREGKSSPILLSGANEVAVEYFLQNKCQFPQIAEVISAVLNTAKLREVSDFEDVVSIDNAARTLANTWLDKYAKAPAQN